MRAAVNQPLTYHSSGVDIAAADTFVDQIRGLMADTDPDGRAQNEGRFAGIYRLPNGTQMAASADGVGTKLLLAQGPEHDQALGQDLVAMNVNDLVVGGARPLFFLDYMAVGKVEPERMVHLVKGISQACLDSSCVLLGGETAEMPDVYRPGHFDLAGFAVGLVEYDQQQAPTVKAGDAILGLPSSGVHANGFSLVRKALQRLDAHSAMSDGGTLLDALMRPTELYVHQVLALLKETKPAAMAHITGGGLAKRSASMLPVPSMLPDQDTRALGLHFDSAEWSKPEVFSVLEAAGIDPVEMANTFNMGLGYLCIGNTDCAEVARGQGWLRVGTVTQSGEVRIDEQVVHAF